MRRAVLVASSQFADAEFAPLRFPVQDAERFRDVLVDHDLCAFDEVALLANEPIATVRRSLERVARESEPGDLLLFYYSGHGQLDRDGALALAMPDSDTKVLGATSLISDEIKRLFNISRAAQKVIILDCCYSGALGSPDIKGTLGGSIQSVAQQLSGSFLLTASKRFERAFELEQEKAGALTQALVEGVRTGSASASGGEHITLTELASYAQKSVLASGASQQPEYWDNGGIGGLDFSKKPARFDLGWMRNARAMVTRYVGAHILDDDLADEIRGVIASPDRVRHAQRLRLVDRLLRKNMSVNVFTSAWPLTEDGAAKEGVSENRLGRPPHGPEAPPVDSALGSDDGGSGDGAGSEDEPAARPPALSRKAFWAPLLVFIMVVLGIFGLGWFPSEEDRSNVSREEEAARQNAIVPTAADIAEMRNAIGDLTNTVETLEAKSNETDASSNNAR